MTTILYWIKKYLPAPLLNALRVPYHYSLSYLGAVMYKHPSRELTVIAVTGTKGKSTVTELLTAILEANGSTVASLSTIQFKIGNKVERNLFKMTTPGRFFVQHFLRKAVDANCTHAVLELSSEGAKQFRHKYIDLDALVFTNLTPEHIESHGSFDAYKAAKLEIAKQLEISIKKPRYIVANTDDEHGQDFLNIQVDEKLPYSLESLKLYTLQKDSINLVFQDRNDEVTIRVPLVGLFNVYNTLAAITLTQALGIHLSTIEQAMRTLPPVRGRVEHITSAKEAPKKVTAVIDYAHTPDSLSQLYKAFPTVYKIGVLGNTGGGRDTWKRPEMAKIAEEYCDHIILTNEDPYDENPRHIVDQMAKGIDDTTKLSIHMDRREAIKTALELVPDGGYVIISGKGTDPYIMGAHNTKEPWSDAQVTRELLEEMSQR